MKLVDELFELYHNKLAADDEDIHMLTLAILEELSYEDLLTIVHDMDEQDLYSMVGLFLIEGIKGKYLQEDYEPILTTSINSRVIH